MEKGLKNLAQAYRSAQKKQNDGIYHDHDDSGVGISDLDEESEDHHSDIPSASEPHFPSFSGGFAPHQRVPSIQSMLLPMQHHPMQYATHHMPHPQ